MKKRYFLAVCMLMATLCTVNLFGLVLGDVNTDGNINIVDALMTAQYAVGLSPAGFSTAAADVDNNMSLNIVDALMIAQYSVGLISVFPPNNNQLAGTYKVIYVPIIDSTVVQ